MRISDWSSDVCSSDLGAGHGEICAFLRGLARHCSSTALALAMHQHLVAAAVANDRAGRPGRKLLEKVAADEAILVSTGANDWLESNGRMERSEEHTSELKSLMRISYAVFCLKKKKTKPSERT